MKQEPEAAEAEQLPEEPQEPGAAGAVPAVRRAAVELLVLRRKQHPESEPPEEQRLLVAEAVQEAPAVRASSRAEEPSAEASLPELHREPQNPTATSKVYFASKFNANARTEKTPRIKEPTTLTTKTLA